MSNQNHSQPAHDSIVGKHDTNSRGVFNAKKVQYMAPEILSANFDRILRKYQPLRKEGDAPVTASPEPEVDTKWLRRKFEHEWCVRYWESHRGKDCKPPFGKPTLYALAEDVLKVANRFDLAPYYVMKILMDRQKYIANYYKYMASPKAWGREVGQESYVSWSERVWELARKERKP